MLRLALFLLGAAATAVASTLPSGRTLTLDPARSTVEVAVKATVDSFTARLDAYEAQLAVDPASGHITGAQFSFGFADLHTGKSKRDAAMLEWLAEDRPGGQFVLQRLESLGPDRFQAQGTLRLHGVVRDIAFPVTITTDRRVYAFDGEATIDTRDHNLPVIRMLGVLKVDPHVRVRFHLQGELGP